MAKKQQVEDEIEALCTHQDQIRALKSRLAKLTAKCSAENVRPDKLFHDPAHGVADMLSDLVDKLDAQVRSESSTDDFTLNASVCCALVR